MPCNPGAERDSQGKFKLSSDSFCPQAVCADGYIVLCLILGALMISSLAVHLPCFPMQP